ncbi:MAG TPA: ion transporter [bacterium]|nr:ion transporter [bacterium]
MKVWNLIIYVALFVTLYFIFAFYSAIEPSEVNRIDNIQAIITILFIIDIIIRIKIYKFEYIKSFDMLIDILSCLDIFGPIMKTFRIFRFARIMRILKLFRIFRLLKIPQIFEYSDGATKKLFTAIGFVSLLFFLIFGILMSGMVQKEIGESQIKKYDSYLKNVVLYATENEKINMDKFLGAITLQKNIVSFDIVEDNFRVHYNFLKLKENELNEYLNSKYFPEDVIEVESNGIKLKLVIKNLMFTAKKIEYYSLFAAMIFYVFLFSAFMIYARSKGNQNG